ncbi:maleylacetate reductase [Williamsia serinedens]|uniref:Maleylacetate reductase n=1 Tax=Williamsia serinedens TaxID=391736 RepID=A0ABT1H355_9NOCA|nr:maleylacetate reductase [Williamsia serinedens]MCP2161187.1 maleylacetate reductase [Williamsia serinedens]
MTEAFVHETLPQRVVFAAGDARSALEGEVIALDARRAMVIASDRDGARVDAIVAGLPDVVRHTEVVMHVPVEVAQRAREVASQAGVDVVVAIGGGSTTGLAKAVALTAGLPVIAVPTTFSGSEATDVWGLTEDGVKTTGVDRRVLPRSVVYDATLLTTLPTDATVASGLNALAHGVDAMWAPRADPIDRALAEEGIRALREGLLGLVAEPRSDAVDDVDRTLYGAYLAAVAFASAGSAMHHKICHVLGGMFDLPHAPTHAVVLPHVLAFNASNAPDAVARIARALGADDAVAGLADLRAAVSAPSALKDLGMPESGIEAAVPRILAAIPADNPTPVTEHALTQLLRAAYEGDDQP